MSLAPDGGNQIQLAAVVPRSTWIGAPDGGFGSSPQVDVIWGLLCWCKVSDPRELRLLSHAAAACPCPRWGHVRRPKSDSRTIKNGGSGPPYLAASL